MASNKPRIQLCQSVRAREEWRSLSRAQHGNQAFQRRIDRIHRQRRPIGTGTPGDGGGGIQTISESGTVLLRRDSDRAGRRDAERRPDLAYGKRRDQTLSIEERAAQPDGYFSILEFFPRLHLASRDF